MFGGKFWRNFTKATSLSQVSKSFLVTSAGISAAMITCNGELKPSFGTHCQSNVSLSKSFVADAVAIASPSVVNILFEVTNMSNAVGMGSGFIISKDGLIITNAHVVTRADGGRVVVTMNDGTKKIGKVHSFDVLLDIALIQLVDVPEDLPVAKIATTDKLQIGDFVASIGSPLSLNASVSFGTVTELGVAQEFGISHPSELIQSDVAIYVGNSGGPMINMQGEVVGVNSIKSLKCPDLGYALPIDQAMWVVRQLIKRKRVRRPYTGLQLINDADYVLTKAETVDDILALPSTAYVLDVQFQSPAQDADIKRGDIILEVNGVPVTTAREATTAFGTKANQTFPVKILRRKHGAVNPDERVIDTQLTTVRDTGKMAPSIYNYAGRY